MDVALARDADTLILTVQDNGVGIDLAGAASRRSLGIVGMRERALLLGGELTIRGLGKGTTVTVRIPDS